MCSEKTSTSRVAWVITPSKLWQAFGMTHLQNDRIQVFYETVSCA